MLSVLVGLLTLRQFDAPETSAALAPLHHPPPPSPPPLLPTNVTCLELAALHNCLGHDHIHAPWPLSADYACRERGLDQLPRRSCAELKRRAAMTAGAGRRSNEDTFDWSDTVFGFPVYNSQSEEDMLKEASRTWLPLVAPNADVVLATDLDDPRDDARIMGLVAASRVRAHVFRCPVCCSGGRPTPGRASKPAGALSRSGHASGTHANGAGSPGADASGTHVNGAGSPGADATARECVGVREGWMARSKVLWMLSHMSAAFGPPHTFGAKRWFFKLDCDTLLHPFHLAPLLHSLRFLADASEPMLVGLASCRSERVPDLCHPAGGAGYMLSAAAASRLRTFVHHGNGGGEDVAAGQDSSPGSPHPSSYGPSWLARLDALTYGGEDVAVALALKESPAAISVINVGGFHQHQATQPLWAADRTPGPAPPPRSSCLPPATCYLDLHLSQGDLSQGRRPRAQADSPVLF